MLSKMDASYRQMRNEALLMLQLTRLKKEISQDIAVVEASAMTGEGIDNMLKWLQGDSITPSKSKKWLITSSNNKRIFDVHAQKEDLLKFVKKVFLSWVYNI